MKDSIFRIHKKNPHPLLMNNIIIQTLIQHQLILLQIELQFHQESKWSKMQRLTRSRIRVIIQIVKNWNKLLVKAHCVFLDMNDQHDNVEKSKRINLTESSKIFVRQSMAPLIKCYKECCNFDANIFMGKCWILFSFSKFKHEH